MTIDDIVKAVSSAQGVKTLKEKIKLRRQIVGELKDVCGVSHTAVWKWDRDGRIPDARVSEISQHYGIGVQR